MVDLDKTELIFGKDLRIDDVIVELGSLSVVTSLNRGSGAGSFDFGEYIVIKTKALNEKVQVPTNYYC